MTTDLFRRLKPVYGQQIDRLWIADRGAVGIVGIGGKAEANGALVDLLISGEELRQAGGPADDHRQDAGGHGIECAEVADLLCLGDSAELADYVVRGPALRLVYGDDSVHSFHSSADRL